MFTRNYDVTREYMTICQAKVPDHQRPCIIDVTGQRLPMYGGTDTSNGMGKAASCLCNNWVTTNYNSLGKGTMTLEIGSGTTPATYDDYNLQSPITTGRSKLNIQYPNGGYSLDWDTMTRSLTVRYVIQNTGSSDIEVNEYGIYSAIYYSNSVTQCLIYREVLDETIILQPNDIYSFDFTYTTEFNYPIIDQYGYIEDSWAEIVEKINNGTANYQIGQCKSLNFIVDNINYNLLMRIIGIDHDDLTNGTGKAKTTWIADRLTFTRAINNSEPATGSTVGWETTSLRTWLQSDVLNAIVESNPVLDVMENGIKMVDKKYTTGTASTLYTCSDSLFLLSNSEWGIGAESTPAGYGDAYSWFDTAQKRKNLTKMDSTWTWLRSINTYRKRFSVISQDAGESSTSCSSSLHFFFCFCI